MAKRKSDGQEVVSTPEKEGRCQTLLHSALVNARPPTLKVVKIRARQNNRCRAHDVHINVLLENCTWTSGQTSATGVRLWPRCMASPRVGLTAGVLRHAPLLCNL